jgi:hypothetical protein
LIDELDSELESILFNALRFPCEVLTLQRFRSGTGRVIYDFEPFLHDLSIEETTSEKARGNRPVIDPSEVDTIVVPAWEDGFSEVFLGEHRWYSVRIHASMIPRLKYVAVYRVKPESAITHFASIDNIKPWKRTGKFVLNFVGNAKPIGPLKLVPDGKIKAPQAPRYTSFDRLKRAKNLDQAF